MRLIVYLVISTMAIVGMPFHFFFNWIGNNDIILQGISATIWLSVILILSLYILRKMSLETAYLATVTSFQVLTSVRIVYLAATATAAQLPLYKELILINEVMTFINFINACLGMLRNGPTYVLVLSLASWFLGYNLNPQALASRFAFIFAIIMILLWVNAVAMRIFISDISQKIDDYKQVEHSILDLLNMSRMEISSLVKLCRQAKDNKELDARLTSSLSEQTRSNLIDLSEYLCNEKRDRQTNIRELLPQLSPTEAEVCRLILKGLTLKEIAIALGKSVNNIGTVRGNIRKKLQLSTGEELRETLMQRLEESATQQSNSTYSLGHGGGVQSIREAKPSLQRQNKHVNI